MDLLLVNSIFVLLDIIVFMGIDSLDIFASLSNNVGQENQNET